MCRIIWVFAGNMSVGGKLSTNPTGSAMAVPTSLPRLKMTPIQRIQARLATSSQAKGYIRFREVFNNLTYPTGKGWKRDIISSKVPGPGICKFLIPDLGHQVTHLLPRWQLWTDSLDRCFLVRFFLMGCWQCFGYGDWDKICRWWYIVFIFIYIDALVCFFKHELNSMMMLYERYWWVILWYETILWQNLWSWATGKSNCRLRRETLSATQIAGMNFLIWSRLSEGDR